MVNIFISLYYNGFEKYDFGNVVTWIVVAEG